LIGNENIPDVDANADTQANNTTDYNSKVGQQPFRYDMLGRFGFSMLPFMEGKEKNEGQAELENELIDLINDKYINVLSKYYKNPNLIKSDFRKYSKDKEVSEDIMKSSVELADKILKIVEKHFDKEIKNLDEQFKENIAEAKVVEDKMVDKKSENEISTKTEDNGVREKKIEKIAGLINKLEKKDINKLINLLEIKK
jgi:hypothetical protein